MADNFTIDSPFGYCSVALDSRTLNPGAAPDKYRELRLVCTSQWLHRKYVHNQTEVGLVQSLWLEIATCALWTVAAFLRALA